VQQKRLSEVEEKLAKQNEEEREEFRQERTALFQERWEKQNEVFKLEQQAELPALVSTTNEFPTILHLLELAGHSLYANLLRLQQATWERNAQECRLAIKLKASPQIFFMPVCFYLVLIGDSDSLY
jgi:hypothetical protein